jgi:hypothetical protein
MPWSYLGLGGSDGDGSGLRSVACGDGGILDFGHAFGRDGSRVVCCRMIGFCMAAPLVDFAVICGGDEMGISLRWGASSCRF